MAWSGLSELVSRGLAGPPLHSQDHAESGASDESAPVTYFWICRMTGMGRFWSPFRFQGHLVLVGSPGAEQFIGLVHGWMRGSQVCADCAVAGLLAAAHS